MKWIKRFLTWIGVLKKNKYDKVLLRPTRPLSEINTIFKLKRD